MFFLKSYGADVTLPYFSVSFDFLCGERAVHNNREKMFSSTG